MTTTIKQIEQIVERLCDSEVAQLLAATPRSSRIHELVCEEHAVRLLENGEPVVMA